MTLLSRVLGIALLLPATAVADDPLRGVIDRELAAVWASKKITPAPASSDAEFLRRVSIDLAGTVPTPDEAARFLADPAADKREKLIDQLLADPRFATAQADVWDLALFGRNPGGGDSTRKRDGFKKWLAEQFAAGVGHDRLVRELLLGEQPGSELFHVQFRGQPEEAAVAVSRLFLGTQLQCARCHDHPFDKWTQKDFYGVAGFFVRVVVQESGSGNTKVFSLGEKATGETLFSGAAKDQAPGRKGDPVKPKFLGGPELDEPPAPKGVKESAPKGNEKLPKPAFSRKEKFAAWASAADNPYLAQAAANRVWAQFMGRGLVHPMDDFTEENAPSHPALLTAMAAGLTAHKFDLKWLIREIVNSKAYQLAGTGPAKEALPAAFERARVRPLSAEEVVAVMRKATAAEPPKAGSGDNGGSEYFMRYFGEPTNGLGEFQGSLAEHLFLNNGEHVRGFARRKKGNLADQLLTAADPWDKKVDRLFLAVLTRPPTPKERAKFVAFLTSDAKVEPRLEDAVWALLNSSEFRFNH